MKIIETRWFFHIYAACRTFGCLTVAPSNTQNVISSLFPGSLVCFSFSLPFFFLGKPPSRRPRRPSWGVVTVRDQRLVTRHRFSLSPYMTHHENRRITSKNGLSFFLFFPFWRTTFVIRKSKFWEKGTGRT